jgi:hypothetical protein
VHRITDVDNQLTDNLVKIAVSGNVIPCSLIAVCECYYIALLLSDCKLSSIKKTFYFYFFNTAVTLLVKSAE